MQHRKTFQEKSNKADFVYNHVLAKITNSNCTFDRYIFSEFLSETVSLYGKFCLVIIDAAVFYIYIIYIYIYILLDLITYKIKYQPNRYIKKMLILYNRFIS